jgi:hypothetical protein
MFEHKLNAIHTIKKNNMSIFGYVELLNKNMNLTINSKINIDNIDYHNC